MGQAVNVFLITRDPMLVIAVDRLLTDKCDELRLAGVINPDKQDNEIALEQLRPDIVLAEVVSLQCMRSVQTVWKKCGGKLLLWCHTGLFQATAELLDDGCAGVIDRCASGEAVLRCLLQAAHGLASCAMGNEQETVSIRLTYREQQLVALLAKGMKNKEIGACLGLSEGTVKIYVSRLLEKTGAKDRYELALIAVKNTLLGRAERGQPVPAKVAERRAMAASMLRSLTLVQREPARAQAVR
jgi:DNA-binding NarL/FixJ family response regulator